MPIDKDIFGDIPASTTTDADIFRDIKSAPSAPLKMAESKPPAPQGPSDTRVALNAGSKGIANVFDMFLNAPTNLLNLQKARLGTVAALVGRPDLAPDVSAPPNYANRALRALGAIGEGGEPTNARQRVIDSAAQTGMGMALNPAGSVKTLVGNVGLGAIGGVASGVTKEATGSDTAAMAAGMLTPVVANAAGGAARNKVADMANKQSANVVRDQTLADARSEGYVIPPSQTNPSFLNNRLESIGGKAAVKQESAIRNQDITNNIAARELGLPKGTAITEGVLDKFRNTESAPYREVAALSPIAKSALDNLKQTRAESKLQWNYFNRSGNPDAMKSAQALDQKAQMLETAIEKIATKAGNPKLVEELRQARQSIAKSYDIERALNVGDASISAPAIGRALDRGAPLTGGLETIGKFAEGPGRQFVGELSRTPSPGVSGTEILGMAGLGTMGAAAHPFGAVAGGLPLLRGPVRSLLLSKPYQNMMGTPNYSAGILANSLSRLPQGTGLSSLMMANPQIRGLLQGQQ